MRLLADALQEFPAGVGELNWGQRLSVLDAWVQVLDGVYAHLPLKRALYGYDPIRAIEHLRQQVPALNLADLARALRPAAAAGDELELNLVKEGRESHQAVGYLPDGTMIVVNHARAFLGKVVTVTVSSALQTGAGRLIFAEVKQNNSPPAK